MKAQPPPSASEQVSVSFAQACRAWLKIGCLGFGGPAGQIALLHRIVVDEKKWASEAQFLHALNYCMLLPGPEAQQLATYMGWLLHGKRGGLAAGGLFILPGFFVILVLSILYAKFSAVSWTNGIFLGLQCAVIALVVEALIRVARRALKSRESKAIAIAAFLALFIFQLPFPFLVIGAGILGAMVMNKPGLAEEPNDEAPMNWRADIFRLLRTSAIGLFLWFSPIALAAWILGGDDLFVSMGLFFAKMAVVTFGGAYAVLTYVAQEVVYAHNWIAPNTMIDGLALAETTPGPLILVLTFVGFQAAYGAHGESPLIAGAIAAAYVTWITFVPSFLWIFLGAPYVEKLRGNRRLTAALTGITAAVVGVIANLTVWFALHVLFAKTQLVGPLHMLLPELQSVRWTSVALAIGATLALNRWGFGLFGTLGGSVAIGWLLAAIGIGG